MKLHFNKLRKSTKKRHPRISSRFKVRRNLKTSARKKTRRNVKGGFPESLKDEMAKGRAIAENHYIQGLDSSKANADKLQMSITNQLKQTPSLVTPIVNKAKSDPRYMAAQFAANTSANMLKQVDDTVGSNINNQRIINAAKMSQTGVPSSRQQYHMTNIATSSDTTL